jgi:hypothetical protein
MQIAETIKIIPKQKLEAPRVSHDERRYKI